MLHLVVLAQVAASVPETVAAPAADNTTLISTIVTAVLALFSWVVNNRVKAKRLQDGLKVLASVAAKGVEVAWNEYTSAKKAANADGKLTPEEAAEAQKKALDAAKSAITEDGKKLLVKTFKDGLDSALSQQVEATYGEFKKTAKPGEPSPQ